MAEKEFFSMDITDSKKIKEGFISSGIDKLDKLLEGGTPKGFTVLLLGTPGSSIEIISKQLACSVVGKTLYVSTEETEVEETELPQQVHQLPAVLPGYPRFTGEK